MRASRRPRSPPDPGSDPSGSVRVAPARPAVSVRIRPRTPARSSPAIPGFAGLEIVAEGAALSWSCQSSTVVWRGRASGEGVGRSRNPPAPIRPPEPPGCVAPGPQAPIPAPPSQRLATAPSVSGDAAQQHSLGMLSRTKCEQKSWHDRSPDGGTSRSMGKREASCTPASALHAPQKCSAISSSSYERPSTRSASRSTPNVVKPACP